MVHTKLVRAFSNSEVTLGIFQVDGITHDPIYVLENPWRNNLKDSCIPAGKYICSPYSGTIHKNVYIVKDVPGRSAILWHPGNTAEETLGCLMPGMKTATIKHIPMILDSRVAMQYLKNLIGTNEFELNIT